MSRSVRLDTLLKPKQLAERVGVTPRTVVRWITEGKLKGQKVGRVWRVRAEDWKEFVDGK
jgi:excisionase family DNA binding protein